MMTDPYRIECRRGNDLVAAVALSPETAARLMAASEVWLDTGSGRLRVTTTEPTEGDL